MSLFLVDKAKCSGDKICAEACPMHIVTFDSSGYPYVKAEDEAKCIYCGHCMAVCPKSALELENLSLEEFTNVDKDWKLSYDQLRTFLKTRRSIRAYKDIEVEREKIEQLIDTARYAPTGRNMQGVKWSIVSGKDKVGIALKHSMDFVKHLIDIKHPWADFLHFKRFVTYYNSGKDPILLDAPAVIVAHGKKDSAPIDKDCAIALTYLELSTYSMDLGACWGGYFEAAVNMWQPLKEYLNIPEENSCYGALMIGYPKYKYKKIPSRKTPEINWV